MSVQTHKFCAAEPDDLLSVKNVAVLQRVNALCCRLQVVDESSQHAGHAAMRDGKAGSRGETHFKVTIVSEAFEGMTTVKRHRQIYQVCSCHSEANRQLIHCLAALLTCCCFMLVQLLDEELKGSVHALSLITKTPSEAGAAAS